MSAQLLRKLFLCGWKYYYKYAFLHHKYLIHHQVQTLVYDETGGFRAALEMVQSKNYMTIIGGPGSGKTATARHIALQLEKQGWEVVPVCKLSSSFIIK
jgi:Cdc6-like AAA superfamily ATPase